MGYYSRFNVRFRSKEKFMVDEILNKLSELFEYDITTFGDYMEDAYDNFEGKLHNDFGFDVMEVKWYDYLQNFIELSKDYPKIHIFIVREGEEWGDYEEDYIYNGELKEKQVEIIYPDWKNDEINDIFKYYRPQ